MNFASVTLRWLLILALLLPSAAATAETRHTPYAIGNSDEAAHESSLGQTVPPLTETPTATAWPTATPTAQPPTPTETVETPTPLATMVEPTATPISTVEIPIADLYTPTVPAFVHLRLDRLVVTGEESASLTVTVQSDALSPLYDLVVQVTLPDGVASHAGLQGVLTWEIASLTPEQPWVQTVGLQAVGEPPPASGRVVEVQARVEAAGYAGLPVSTALGLAASRGVTETQQSSQGAVLQSADGVVTLLSPAGAAAEGVTLRYQSLYDWANATPTTTLSSGLASQTSGAGEIRSSTSPISVSSGNVEAYAIWQLEASENQQASELAGEVYLAVSAAALVARGVEPTHLSLWSREQAGERWQELATDYDPSTQRLSAWLPHFSEFTLGEGLTLHGQLLPSIRAFSTDRFSGGAQVHIPIEVPAGLGGLAPNLSLSYSSVTVDDLFRNTGPDSYKVQVSGVGMGWSVGGVSYISRADNRLDDDTPWFDREFVMALNGQFVHIKYEHNAWRSDPALFAQFAWDGTGSCGPAQNFCPWTVTTRDGVKYTFGDTTPFSGSFSASSANATFLQETVQGNHYRLNKEWYLSKVEDPLGNQMEFSYMLDSLEERGKSGGVLQRYTFSYLNVSPNTIRLQGANSSYGAQIGYTYSAHRPSCANSVCNNSAGYHWRYAVTRLEVNDGLGKIASTVYYYGPTNSAGNEWAAVADSGEFMNFKASEATYYALNSSSTVVKWDRHDTWQGPRSDPNPRRGRTQKVEVRASASGATLARSEYTWQAYHRNYFGSCSTAEDGWCMTPTDSNVHTSGNNVVYHTLWVRLEATSEWVADAGKLTKPRYETANQNGGHYGNVTTVEEYSHSGESITLTNWEAAVTNNTAVLLRKTVSEYFPNSAANLVNKPGRVRVYSGGNVCKSEVRTVYDNVDGNYNVAPSKGEVKKREQALAACSSTATIPTYDANWLVTRLTTDVYGNVTTVNQTGVDANRNDVTTTQYDSTYKLFPTQQSRTIKSSGQADQTLSETAKYYGANGAAVSNGRAFWGAMEEHCGVNDVCTRQSYDEFGRPLRRWERAIAGSTWGSDASANLKWEYYAPGQAHASQPSLIVVEWRAPRGDGNFTRKVYNGLGQLVQVQTPQQERTSTVAADNCSPGSAGHDVDVSYAYDALGNPIRVSVPQAGDRSLWYNRLVSDWSSVPHTLTTYDALNRVTSSTAPNGERTVNGYNGRARSLIAEGVSGTADDRKLQRHTLDGLGYLSSVRNELRNGTSWSIDGEVLLSHDVLGNLTAVTHAGSTGSTTMSYDLAGRKTARSDVDLGSWSYAYDRQGNLTRQTDGRGWSTCLYYDSGGRLLGKHYRSNTSCPSSVTTYHVEYAYGGGAVTPAQNRGQLLPVRRNVFENNAWVEAHSQALSYSNKGLVSSAKVKLQGGASGGYTTSYGYDRYNRPSATTYPDGEVVTVYYNSMGLPAKLNSSQSGDLVDGSVNVSAVSDAVSYDLAGRLSKLRFPAGGNLWRTWKYAPWSQQDGKGGRLISLRVGTSSDNGDESNWGSPDSWNRGFQNYDYDRFGNVITLEEGYNNSAQVTSSFSYDGLNRLTSGFGKSYTYHSSGRLASYEGASYTADTVHKHAISQVGGVLRYEYDANGNMTTRNLGLSDQQVLSWDYENRLSAVSSEFGVNESYLYDADGQRVRKVSNGGATYYPFPHYEVTGSTVTKYYFFAGQRIAMKVGATLYFLHGDGLNSTSLVTNQSGAVHSSQTYCAYGRKRSGTTTFTCGSGNSLPTAPRGHPTFTGQKLDGSGLQYFNARYYDPQLGTFISPDTLVPDAGVVFDYNRYMYVRGNPMHWVDPSGNFSEEQLSDWFGENWRTMFSQAWIKLLLDSDNSQIVAAQLGDVVVIGNGNSTIQGVFVLDESGGLVLWDVNNKTPIDVMAMGGASPNMLGLYRIAGGETGAESPRFDYLTGGTQYLPATNLGFGGPHTMNLIGQYSTNVSSSEPISLPGGWFLGQNGSGYYVHNYMAFQGFNFGSPASVVGTAGTAAGAADLARTTWRGQKPTVLGGWGTIASVGSSIYVAMMYRPVYILAPCPTMGVNYCGNTR